VDDPSGIITILEVPSLEHARQLSTSTSIEMPNWMERIGLEIYPTFFVGEQTDVHDYLPAPDPDPRG
jgi:hypothetical protein